MSKSFTKIDLNENDVRELLSYIPAPQKGTNSREFWIKVISATCAALNGNEAAALALLKEWSPEWQKNAYETALRSFGGKYKSTAATLVFLAKENGYDASAKAKERAAQKPASAKKDPPAPRSEKTDTAATRVDLGKCSICESPRKPETVKPCKLIVCLRAIKLCKWRNEVAAVRAGTREKSTLPQVCAYGVFNDRRKDENLFTRSGFIVLDYDGKDNTGTDFSKLRSRLAKLPFTLAVFTSPSGNGLKALVRVPDGASDEAALHAAAEILAPLGGKLDTGSEARKHFIVSADENAFISETPLDEIPPLDAWEHLPPAALAVIFAETVENFFFSGKEDYFFNDAGTIKSLSVAAAREEFEVRHGASRKAARLALYAVRKSRYV
ncbi:MAG: PriCT-2 domain-containing protein, partial [Opitutales bacterium]|nr:PriCT-2 domain-containing protein [Opitutales bacterium]